MSDRRSFLKTVVALVTALVMPISSVFGYSRKARLIVNGIEMALPDKLDIRIEIDGVAVMQSVKLEIVGGVLKINEGGTGQSVAVHSSKGGGIEIGGDRCISVWNMDSGLQPTISFYPNVSDSFMTIMEREQGFSF